MARLAEVARYWQEGARVVPSAPVGRQEQKMDLVFDYDDPEMFQDQRKQVAEHKALGPAKAEYFALLDRYIFEDDFWTVLSEPCIEKLMEHYVHVGEMIRHSQRDIVAASSLTDAETNEVASAMQALGLYFSTDTSEWDDYRKSKERYDRLTPLNRLNSHFAQEVRRYFGRYSTSRPLSLHM